MEAEPQVLEAARQLGAGAVTFLHVPRTWQIIKRQFFG